MFLCFASFVQEDLPSVEDAIVLQSVITESLCDASGENGTPYECTGLEPTNMSSRCVHMLYQICNP